MERQIGEIFEYNGEWYQCVEAPIDEHSCNGCQGCKGVGGPRIFGGECDVNARKDGKFVIFRKLEKIGEPYMVYGHIVQKYKFFHSPAIQIKGISVLRTINSTNTIQIEIKQNKEDMEEKKSAMDFVVTPPRLTGDKPDHQLNLKPFDIQKAKEGKPICTKNGKRARIICFNAKGVLPIIALVESGDEEKTVRYSNSGRFRFDGMPDEEDLMMSPERKSGWINIYNADTTFYYVDGRVFETKDKAAQEAKEEVEKGQREKNEYINTIRVEWEERYGMGSGT